MKRHFVYVEFYFVELAGTSTLFGLFSLLTTERHFYLMLWQCAVLRVSATANGKFGNVGITYV